MCHTCDIPSCVNPEHLFLGTHLTNARDKIKKGRAAEREKHGRAILNTETAREIRVMLAAGRRIACIAAVFGINRRTIYNIRDNETWRVP